MQSTKSLSTRAWLTLLSSFCTLAIAFSFGLFSLLAAVGTQRHGVAVGSVNAGIRLGVNAPSSRTGTFALTGAAETDEGVERYSSANIQIIGEKLIRPSVAGDPPGTSDEETAACQMWNQGSSGFATAFKRISV